MRVRGPSKFRHSPARPQAPAAEFGEQEPRGQALLAPEPAACRQPAPSRRSKPRPRRVFEQMESRRADAVGSHLLVASAPSCRHMPHPRARQPPSGRCCGACGRCSPPAAVCGSRPAPPSAGSERPFTPRCAVRPRCPERASERSEPVAISTGSSRRPQIGERGAGTGLRRFRRQSGQEDGGGPARMPRSCGRSGRGRAAGCIRPKHRRRRAARNPDRADARRQRDAGGHIPVRDAAATAATRWRRQRKGQPTKPLSRGSSHLPRDRTAVGGVTLDKGHDGKLPLRMTCQGPARGLLQTVRVPIAGPLAGAKHKLAPAPSPSGAIS